MIKIDEGSSDSEVRIEIVPLIDVIFCILTFFILASVTLTRQNAINVTLPRASTGQSQMRQLLVVGLGPVQDLYLEKAPVTREQLALAVQQFAQANAAGTVVVYANGSASYDDVVQLLDLLRTYTPRVALATTGRQVEDQNPFSPAAPGAVPLNPATGLPDFSAPLQPGQPALPTLPTSPTAVPNSIAPTTPNQPAVSPSQPTSPTELSPSSLNVPSANPKPPKILAPQ